MFAQRFDQVGLWSDWPGRAGAGDTGIDLVAREADGTGLCAIQRKLYDPAHHCVGVRMHAELLIDLCSSAVPAAPRRLAPAVLVPMSLMPSPTRRVRDHQLGRAAVTSDVQP